MWSYFAADVSQDLSPSSCNTPYSRIAPPRTSFTVIS